MLLAAASVARTGVEAEWRQAESVCPLDAPGRSSPASVGRKPDDASSSLRLGEKRAVSLGKATARPAKATIGAIGRRIFIGTLAVSVRRRRHDTGNDQDPQPCAICLLPSVVSKRRHDGGGASRFGLSRMRRI
jgi:hypothetical protein